MVVRWAGVAYLVYPGVRTLLDRETHADIDVSAPPERGALRQGVVTEVLNPKTALFFLSFLVQFVNPDGAVFWQFVLLGSITTLPTSGVDLVVAYAAAPLFPRARMLRQRAMLAGIVGLGAAWRSSRAGNTHDVSGEVQARMPSDSQPRPAVRARRAVVPCGALDGRSRR